MRKVFVSEAGVLVDENGVLLSDRNDNVYTDDIDPSGGSSTAVVYVGTYAALTSDANTARPAVAGPVYWLMANGVTPVNAEDGDIIFNADA